MPIRTLVPANAPRAELNLMQMCTRGFFFCHHCQGATTAIPEPDPESGEPRAACTRCGGHALSWHKPTLPD